MTVDTRHPQYSRRYKDWQQIRDCIQGQSFIKMRGETYLPKSSGQKAIEKKFHCGGPENPGPYEMYKSMARFPDIVDNTIQGFVGLATRKAWDIQGLPTSLEYLIQDAGNGIGLDGWQAMMISEGLSIGQYAIFPDAPVDGGPPRLAWYTAEALINWKTERGNPVLVVFEEEIDNPQADEFQHDKLKQYRVLRMEDGACYVDIYDESGGNVLTGDQERIRLDHAEEYCPVVVGGAVNNDWTVDKPPMLGVSECAVAYYQISAQQRWAIRQTCDPMFLALGFQSGEIEIFGGGTVFEKEAKPGEASIEVIEVSGQGIDKASEQMVHELQEAEKMSHRLTDKSSVEASKSLKQRTNSKTATLKSVDRNAAAALQDALTILATINGTPSDITVTSSFDYTDAEVDGVILSALSTVAEKGQLPQKAVEEYARDHGLLEGYDDTEIALMLEEDEQRRQERAVAFFQEPEDEDA